jgi:hypothetical protein
MGIIQTSIVMEALLTENPNYGTFEGIEPVMPLGQSEKVYGKAT